MPTKTFKVKHKWYANWFAAYFIACVWCVLWYGLLGCTQSGPIFQLNFGRLDNEQKQSDERYIIDENGDFHNADDKEQSNSSSTEERWGTGLPNK